MNNTNQFLFAISLFVTLFMGVISYLSYKRHSKKDFIHLTELWAALALNVVINYFSQNKNPQIVALSMVGWIWPFLAMTKILKDISGSSIMHQWKYITLAAGGFISVALASFQYSFFTYTLPFAIVVSAIGILTIVEAFKKTPQDVCSPLHWATYFMMGLFFIQKTAFPFWRLDGAYTNWGFFAELVTMIGLAGSSLSVYLELLKNIMKAK